jgi:hypothetical protein
MTEPLTFTVDISAVKTADTIYHDPNGEDIQLHGVEDGDLVISFSDGFCEKSGWQVEDTLVWTVDANAIKISCPAAEERLRKQEAQAEYDRMRNEGTPI